MKETIPWSALYSFGCVFVHSSNLRDFWAWEPFHQIAEEERDAVLRHLCHYHGGRNGVPPRFTEVAPFCAMALTKTVENLEFYVKGLEQDVTREQWTL